MGCVPARGRARGCFLAAAVRAGSRARVLLTGCLFAGFLGDGLLGDGLLEVGFLGVGFLGLGFFGVGFSVGGFLFAGLLFVGLLWATGFAFFDFAMESVNDTLLRAMTLDLDAYLDRIGWRGPLATDLATLTGLLDRHVTAIPFENLDVLLGRPPRLDLATLQDKLVRARRGGYCYEHATLFAAVLEQCGFSVATHSARVTLLVAKAAAPRMHMFLTVALPDGTVVVDPGFGGLTPRIPVPTNGIPVRCGDDQFRLVREGADHVLEVQTPDKTVAAWVSSLSPDYPVDFEMGNHFTATHPSSPFTQRIMMRAFTEDGRITIGNRDVTRFRGASSKVLQLPDRQALRDTLVAHFGFDLDVEALRVPQIPEWT